MAKRKPRQPASQSLFVRTPRRAQVLFIPRFLKQAAGASRFDLPLVASGRSVLARWADLEASGDLQQAKETSLDANFLLEVFGTALGYQSRTEAPGSYSLDRMYTVAGVGTADGALGDFPSNPPVAVIELKDAGTDLDRDRFSGRTPVQQLWDYLNGLPECPWGILSNFSTIRLYHRNRTPRAYESFSLAELKQEEPFRRFYCLLGPGGLLPTPIDRTPRAIKLLEDTSDRQRTVGDDLYKEYSLNRLLLIQHLLIERGFSQDRAIRAAQLLIDRIIFIAFCEDRGLLQPDTIRQAYAAIPPYPPPNARFRNFLNLFRALDTGHPDLKLPGGIGYNGGLFKYDPDVDGLDLPDIPWAEFFHGVGKYDFRNEVSVDVLGHLFEKSITELERIRVGALFAAKNGNGKPAALASPMPKSAQRKLFGIYYTPPEFTSLIVAQTIDRVAAERLADLAQRLGVDPDRADTDPPDRRREYWRAALDALKRLTVIDPACGSGAFLIRAYDALELLYQGVCDGLAAAEDPEAAAIEASIPDLILTHNLHGVDLSAEAVEISQLALWIRSATPGRTLADLSHNIICGNSLVDDAGVHPRAMNWRQAFPGVFAAGGFDCVIGNPPWERVKVQEREFFAQHDPETAQAVSAADRRKRIAELPDRDPDLYAAYQRAKEDAERTLTYARASGRYPLTGKGDINTYMLFAELARAIVAPDGVVGLLTPSGIATDETSSAFFRELMDAKAVATLYDFENRRKVFPDVDGRFKFSVFVFGGSARTFPSTDFVFFAHAMEQLTERARHIPLSAADLKRFNPNTRTCPIFRSRRDADLTRHVYERVPILIDESRKEGGNPWGVRFLRMFDQTNDAEKFIRAAQLKKRGFAPRGNRWAKGKQVYLPLYEAKMIQAYDHRAASVVVQAGNWMRQGQKAETTLAEHQNPEHLVMPRFWVKEGEVAEALCEKQEAGFLGFKDITSSTNERTMIASWAPWAGFTNHFVLLRNEQPPRRALCLLANLNSLPLDYVVRQKIGAVTLNFFIVEQFPIFSPDTYADRCPWSHRTTLESWISDRVLKLTCTAEDMKPLALACEFAGSLGDGVHKWKERERVELTSELDAAFFHLYQFTRDDAEYILSTFTGTRAEADGGTLATQDRRQLVLDAFDRLAER